MITTDSESGNNLVIWERTPDVGSLSYNFYRQSSVLNQFNLIGNVPADELSVFEDLEADPEKQQWVYKITAIDTCGNESSLDDSPYHIPLFLQYVSADNGVNLRWVPYRAEDGNMNFVSYIIFRGTDSTSLESVAEISSALSVYRDTDPNALRYRYFYRIAGVREEACTPLPESKKAGSGPFIHSLSNLEDNKLKVSTSVNSIAVKEITRVYPNPVSDILFVESMDGNSIQQVRIIDLNGRLLIHETLAGLSSHSLDLSSLSKGVYLVEVDSGIPERKMIVKD